MFTTSNEYFTAYTGLSGICEFIKWPIYSVCVFPEFSRANIITLKLVCSFELKRKKKKPRLNKLMSKLLGQGNDAVSENLQTKGPK